MEEEFETWATSKGFSLEPGTVENGKGGRTYADDRTHYALLGYLNKQFAVQPEIDELLTALRETLAYAESKTCSHDETHRGGAIWEICDSCGAKWADDEGGKPAFLEPKEIKAAAAILAKYSKEKP